MSKTIILGTRPATGDGEALVGSTPPGSTGARGT
jgi:hypothetical protein